MHMSQEGRRLLEAEPMNVQEDVKAAAKAALQSKGLGAGGTRKRLRLVEKETRRLHQVPLATYSGQKETSPNFPSAHPPYGRQRLLRAMQETHLFQQQDILA